MSFGGVAMRGHFLAQDRPMPVSSLCGHSFVLLFASLSPLPLLALGKVRNGGRAGRQGQKGSNFTVW